MKTLLFATSTIIALAAGGVATAADMPVKARPLPPPPIYNWTSCFIGGHVGGVWVDKDFALRSVGAGVGGVVFANPVDFGSHSGSGFLGGLQAGCDYQVPVAGWVVGIQGDYAWADVDGSHIDPITRLTTLQSTTKSLATVTGRIGYAWDRFLGYVRGGAAWERDDYRWFVTATPTVSVSASESRGGWTVGIGGEYAFTDWLSAFVEYDYYAFGTRAVALPVVPARFNFDVQESKSVIKGGLSFRFGAPAPVVARY
ncbi:MAG: porin family protein [Hyphomicrobiales bacterium]|nr:porin family protein [Hyphomicrobiales bacterium]